MHTNIPIFMSKISFIFSLSITKLHNSTNETISVIEDDAQKS
jgi:hypothetical protein